MPAQRGDCVKPLRMYGGLCFAKHVRDASNIFESVFSYLDHVKMMVWHVFRGRLHPHYR